MSRPHWICNKKKKSCKWCFNLMQDDQEVFCKIHGWRRICPPGYFLERRQANTLIDEFRQKTKKCLDYDGEIFSVKVKERNK